MKHETERIWSLLDVQIAWTDSANAVSGAKSARLTVMLEEGRYPEWVANREVMLASVHQLTDPCGSALAHLWVRHIQRHAALIRPDGHPFAALPTALADTLVARALGRALAHEIGHYVLDTARHSSHGLMRTNFAPQELLEDAIRPLYSLSSDEQSTLVSCRTAPPIDHTVVDEGAESPSADVTSLRTVKK